MKPPKETKNHDSGAPCASLKISKYGDVEETKGLAPLYIKLFKIQVQLRKLRRRS